MNLTAIVAGAVLVIVVVAVVVHLLARPRSDRTHLTVADLRARIAEEEAAAKPVPADEPPVESLDEAAPKNTSPDTARPDARGAETPIHG